MRGFMIKCGERRLEGWKYVRLPMNDAVMATVKCMWVDIWCMLD